jgi:hypothetical protein
MGADPKKMTCIEFQLKLPELINSGEDPEDLFLHPHPQTCARCYALLVDLGTIAEKARRLYPGEGPHIN